MLRTGRSSANIAESRAADTSSGAELLSRYKLLKLSNTASDSN